MADQATVVQIASIATRGSSIADIDGDGLNDIVVGVTNQLGSSEVPTGFAVFYGMGNGTFSAPMSYLDSGQGGSTVWSLATADLDGDGRPTPTTPCSVTPPRST